MYNPVLQGKFTVIPHPVRGSPVFYRLSLLARGKLCPERIAVGGKGGERKWDRGNMKIRRYVYGREQRFLQAEEIRKQSENEDKRLTV